jgi:hypothetical protein
MSRKTIIEQKLMLQYTLYVLYIKTYLSFSPPFMRVQFKMWNWFSSLKISSIHLQGIYESYLIEVYLTYVAG